MADAIDYKLIVQRLNAPPLEKALTIVQLHDEFQPIQLFQIINDVLVIIDPHPNSPHRVDVRNEDPNEMAARMIAFLRLLRYRPMGDGYRGNDREGYV